MFYLIDLLADLTFEQALVVFVAFVLAIVIALVLHEYMHAWVAVKQGDLTPKAYGRLTLNPVAHFDPIGLLCFIIIGFGWAKPVPINTLNFKNHKKGVILTSIAGVATNFIVCFFFVLLWFVFMQIGTMPELLWLFLFQFLSISISINMFLAIFNLLPIYPLDGFNLINAFCRYGNKFVEFMQKWGSIILIVLILLPIPGTGYTALGWIVGNISDLIIGLFENFWSLIFYGRMI